MKNNLRGNSKTTSGTTTTTSSLSIKNQNPSGFVGDIGFGYSLSDQIRTDMTFNYANLEKKVTIIDSKVTSKPRYMSLMVNAYYDIINSSEFTPYVMLGLGYARNEFKLSKLPSSLGLIDANNNPVTSLKFKKTNSFAYQLGTGIAYKMSQDFYLDLGYKFTGFGNTKMKLKKNQLSSNSTTDFNTKSKYIHSITAGVRFDF